MGRRIKTARLEKETPWARVYSFRGPRSHRRNVIEIRYFPYDPVRPHVFCTTCETILKNWDNIND